MSFKSQQPKPQIRQWSFSRWTLYERCPRQAKFKFLDRLPDASPRSEALVRGEAIHKLAEQFVKGELKTLPQELKLVAKAVRDLRKKKAQAELELAVDASWKQTGWFDANVWARAKIDALSVVKDTADVVDHKTGRFKPGDAGYAQQLELYGAFVLSHHEDVTHVNARLLFIDHGKDVARSFHRDELGQLKKVWLKRVEPMLNDTVFPPRPGQACGWCPYSKSKGGPCEY